MDAKSEHWIYRYRDENDRILYVGVTNDPPERDAAHRRNSNWYRFAYKRELIFLGELTRAEALVEERDMIKSSNTVFNKTHNPNHESDMVGYVSAMSTAEARSKTRRIPTSEWLVPTVLFIGLMLTLFLL